MLLPLLGFRVQGLGNGNGMPLFCWFYTKGICRRHTTDLRVRPFWGGFGFRVGIRHYRVNTWVGSVKGSCQGSAEDLGFKVQGFFPGVLQTECLQSLTYTEHNHNK